MVRCFRRKKSILFFFERAGSRYPKARLLEVSRMYSKIWLHRLLGPISNHSYRQGHRTLKLSNYKASTQTACCVPGMFPARKPTCSAPSFRDRFWNFVHVFREPSTKGGFILFLFLAGNLGIQHPPKKWTNEQEQKNNVRNGLAHRTRWFVCAKNQVTRISPKNGVNFRLFHLEPARTCILYTSK